MTTNSSPDLGNIFSGDITVIESITIVDPSTLWNGEILNLLFLNGSTSGTIASSKSSNSGGSETLGGTFSF
jgi:hypothetical protein